MFVATMVVSAHVNDTYVASHGTNGTLLVATNKRKHGCPHACSNVSAGGFNNYD